MNQNNNTLINIGFDDKHTNLQDSELNWFGLPSLSSLRQKKGDSIEQAAYHLRLSAIQLRALEDKDWSKLPDSAYIKGFLRNYARYLNIDATPYIAQFELATALQTPQSIESATHVALQSKSVNIPMVSGWEIKRLFINLFENINDSKFNYIKLALFFIAITFIFLTVWDQPQWWSKFKVLTMNTVHTTKNRIEKQDHTAITHTENSSYVPPILMPAQSNLNNTNDSSKLNSSNNDLQNIHNSSSIIGTTNISKSTNTVDNTQIDSKTHLLMRTLEFSLTDTSWIKVSNVNKEVLLHGEYLAGSVQTISGIPPFKIVIGAADSVKLTVDGVLYDISNHTKGRVASFILS